MNKQEELNNMKSKFIESVKELFEKKKKLDDEFPYIEGKTVYKEETGAKTYIIAKYTPIYMGGVDRHNIKIIHVNKESKKFTVLEDNYVRFEEGSAIGERVESVAKREVDRATNIFNLGHYKNY